MIGVVNEVIMPPAQLHMNNVAIFPRQFAKLCQRVPLARHAAGQGRDSPRTGRTCRPQTKRDHGLPGPQTIFFLEKVGNASRPCEGDAFHLCSVVSKWGSLINSIRRALP
jgi:hypothetical protein